MCECDCGNVKQIHTMDLTTGDTKSCGCLERENQKTGSITHGHTTGGKKSIEFLAWVKAKGRCYNPRDKKYKDYGGRGIVMCEKWLNDFQAFYDDMSKCPPRYTLDRIDVNGPYSPDNCRWATSYTQSRNKRNNVHVDFNGETMILKDFANIVGVNYKSLWMAIKRGASHTEAAERLLGKRP